jgi:NAD(P)-dependent dehydrogenase (short-subunit alcohol dehydrogenase family)
MAPTTSSKQQQQPRQVATKWYDNYIKTNLSPNNFTGKTVAITGSTTGTGYHLAEECVQQGAGTVLLLNRPSERAEAAQSKLQELAKTKSTSSSDTDTAPKPTVVETIPCDLQDFDSVRNAAQLIQSKYEAIDVLCNNGGIMALEDVATKDGYDVQMQTNHLSHFLLTKELFPLLQRAAELRGEARIVNHSSLARNGTPLKEEYLGKNGGNLGGNGASMILHGARWERYHQTKLANAAFTLELSQRLGPDSKIKAVVAAPGLAATNLQTNSNAMGGMGGFDWIIMRMAQSSQDGTLPLLAACFDPTTVSGDFWEASYFQNLYGPPGKVKFDKNSLDANQRTMLWKKSEDACGEFKLPTV